MSEQGGLILSLSLAGLIGSLGHCVGMCGPFVLAQTVSRLRHVPAGEMRELHRLTGGALLPYHLGRATTYAGLGALAAAFADRVIDLTGLKWLSAALLALAALFFLGYALSTGLPLPKSLKSGGPGGWGERLGRLARPLFARPLGWRGFALGVVLGFLPCGLLWGALVAAAASGDALAGALGMLAFTLGTMPALLAVALAGHVAGQRWRGWTLRFAPALMGLNAVMLSYLAWRTLI